MQISVLRLLSAHTCKFAPSLPEHNVKLFDYLVKMLESVKNAGLRSSVCRALSALTAEVSVFGDSLPVGRKLGLFHGVAYTQGAITECWYI